MKRKLRVPVRILVALVLGLGLLLSGGISGARAVLNYTSDQYTSNIETSSIDVALVENGNVNPGELLVDLLGDDKVMIAGKQYDESLQVTNNGDINAFVRVTLRKYWKDA